MSPHSLHLDKNRERPLQFLPNIERQSAWDSTASILVQAKPIRLPISVCLELEVVLLTEQVKCSARGKRSDPVYVDAQEV